MTRETDRHLAPEVRADLDARVEFTERHDPDLFISVHANWAENKGAQGFEIFYPRAGCAASAAERQASKRLAETIQGIFAKRFDTPDRGVKEAGFFVIKNAPCPSVLVELDFVSNLASEKKLREASYREKLADAVADAVLAEHRR
jgi:N-acetylmuramoyl-L-alanine amidase